MTQKQHDETGDVEYRVSDGDLPPFFFEQDRPSGRASMARVRERVSKAAQELGIDVSDEQIILCAVILFALEDDDSLAK